MMTMSSVHDQKGRRWLSIAGLLLGLLAVGLVFRFMPEDSGTPDDNEASSSSPVRNGVQEEAPVVGSGSSGNAVERLPVEKIRQMPAAADKRPSGRRRLGQRFRPPARPADMRLEVVAAGTVPAVEHVSLELRQGDKIWYDNNDGAATAGLSIEISEWVVIRSGAFADWEYAAGRYSTGAAAGEIHFVQRRQELRGALSGDLNGGLVMADDGIRGNLTVIMPDKRDGVAGRTLQYSAAKNRPGAVSVYDNVLLTFVEGLAVVGNGPAMDRTRSYQQTTTVVVIPVPDGDMHSLGRWRGAGFSFGNYAIGAVAGRLWSYLDNTRTMMPFRQPRYVMRAGKLTGAGIQILDGLPRVGTEIRHWN